ncbi:MAG TPA: hypothetical protein PKX31_14895 [Chitinophagaceae bacterium]|nr:hypothetical protein [Chitinophagaceae bacterium]
MNLKEKILLEHTKTNREEIVNWIGSNQTRFDELVKLFLGNDKLITQRSGWPLSFAGIAHPEFIPKHLGKLVTNLKQKDLHDAVKRNTIRLLQEISIPKKYLGDVMNICFDFIISPTEKPAIKAFSLTVLENLSKEYPEIKQELKTVIEDRWDYETAAFHSRAKKILKNL